MASHPAGQWTGYGPSGGRIDAIEIGPDGAVYATAGGQGFFVSRDAGVSWQRRGNGLPTTYDILDIAVSPVSAGRIYLATGLGAYRTDDAGLTWRRISEQTRVASVAVDPTNPDIVFLGDAALANHKSTDGGSTWTQLTTPLARKFASDLIAIAPSDPKVIYATEPPSLLRSNDGGATWQGTNGYLSFISDLAIDRRNPQILYAATHFDGVQRSTDGGRTWTTGTGWPNLGAVAVAIDRSEPTTIYASTAEPGTIYRSRDSGSTWQRLSIPGSPGSVRNIVSAGSGTVYVGTEYSGVFRSLDRGATWSRRTAGIYGMDVRHILVMPGAPNTIFAATSGDGIYRSTDGAHTWSRRGLLGLPVRRLASPRTAAQTAYAATGKGVYKTSDSGATWRLVYASEWGASDGAIAPSNSSVVYAVNHVGAVKSVDAGQTWTKLNVPGYTPCCGYPGYRSVAVHPTNSRIVWVGGNFLSNTVLRSTDGGATWRSAVSCPVNYGPSNLVVDRRQPNVLYATCLGNEGLRKSTDSGLTWRWVPTPVGGLTSMVIDPNDSKRLYIGVYDDVAISGVYRTVDGGTTWQRLAAGMTTTPTYAVAISPTSSVLHAGTETGGVFSRPLA